MIPAKKIFVWFVMLLVLPMANALAQPDLTVGAATGQPGATVNIPVSFTNNGAVVAMSFDITFNPALVTPGTMASGAGLAPHTVATSVPTPGTLRVLVNPPFVNPLPAANNGILLTVPWTIAAGATSAIPLTLTNVTFADTAARSVPAGALTSGQITP